MALRADLRWVNIPRLVQDSARSFPVGEALVDGDVRLTFPGLSSAMGDAGRAAIAVGLRPGDRAAIWAPNIGEWVIAALGLLSAGVVLVPLNTRFKGSEAAYILAKSGARALFTITDFLGTDYVAELAPHRAGLPLETVVVLRGPSPPGTLAWVDYLARGAATVSLSELEQRIAAIQSDDLSDIIFTSGTTGRPKGVMTTHGQSLRVYEAWTDVVGLTEGDRYLVVNPFFHTFGYKAGFLAAIMRGATTVPHAVFDVTQVLERVAAERISMLPGPPTLYQSILNHADRDRFDLSSLRLAVTGAAVVPVEMIRRMREELTFKTIVTGYGLTESTGTVAMCRHDDDPETIANTSGRAIPDTEVRVISTAGEEVPRGEPGEVVVRGYNVMVGYFDDPAETAAAIDGEGWLHTGDIGVMDDRGYLRITDRLKDMFIVGGFNAYPAEIEGTMLRHPAVAQAAVVGVSDDRMGEVGMAFIVPRPGASIDADELIAWCRREMANYKVPRRVEVVGSLPLNASGKVLKHELRAKARSSTDRSMS
jgi:HIP---CoA ligase